MPPAWNMPFKLKDQVDAMDDDASHEARRAKKADKKLNGWKASAGRSGKRSARKLKPCAKGSERNPASNRCKKVRSPARAAAAKVAAAANPWIAHVKAYQAANGVSYKVAMQMAAASYKAA